MSNLRVGDVYERDNCGDPFCQHWRRKPSWKIWLAWFFRLLGWEGPPA